MKFRYLITTLLAAAALAFTGCKEEEEDLALPNIAVSGSGIEFDKVTKKAVLSVGEEQSTFTTSLTANRPWTIDIVYGSSEKDWIVASPDRGEAASHQQDVTLTLLANEGRDRTATVKYNIGYDYKTLTITQKGRLGSMEDATLYANDFDKETVTGNTYLDAGSQWRHETGSGIANVSYEFSGMSARTSGTSSSSENYTASGANNLFFGANAHFQVRNIALGGQTNLKLTFGAVRNQYGETTNVFDHEEFKVYAAVDGAKWKELTYAFPGGVDPDGVWEIATVEFTLPSGTESLYLYFQANLASSYRIDDLMLVVNDGAAGTPLDFSDGVTLPTDGNTTEGGGTTPEEPTDVKAVTVAEFLAAPESSTQVYELVGTIGGSINTQYGNFDLVDETETVYVYGLTATNLGYGAKNDQSYASLGLVAGDKIKIRGYRGSYNDKIEVMYAWFIEKVEGSGNTPGTDPAPGTGSKFESDAAFVCSTDDSGNANYTLGNETTFNGERATGFKLGKSSASGQFTSSAVGVEGDYTLSFYAVAWKGQKATVKISVSGGGSVEGTGTFELRSNDGATSNPPFTISLDEATDHYSAVLKGLTRTSTVTFETVDGTYRAVVAGVHLTEGTDGGTTDPGTGGGTTPEQPTDVKAVTVTEFLAAPESETQVYELVGTIGGSINTQYGNFDLVDATGTVYVYGLTATNLGYGAKNDQSYASLGLVAGDKIKIRGYRGSYNGKDEVMYAWFIEKVEGSSNDPGTGGGTTPEQPTDVKAVTVTEFLAAPESDTQVYELVGTIGGSINTTYGNFDLVDATGTVYVYGLTATNLGYGATNDKSYASLGLVAGDKIKIRGYRYIYTNSNTGETKDEVMYAWFIEKVEGSSNDPGTGGGSTGGDNPGGNTDPDATTGTFDFSTQKYENGAEVSSVKFGDVTVTFDKGTNSNSPKYYDGGTAVRVYGGSTVTVEAGGKTITGIKFTYGTNDNTNEISASTGTFTTDTWTGSATSVTFTIGGTTGHRRFKAVAVTYK